jgi:pimeloyl-ACP methyl ester carboxylesterase
VLLAHGFPELAHSWCHQVAALAAAGFRVAAPDMRGYGGTTAPADIEQYTLLHLVGDMVDLVRVLGETQAVIVGHDWGAAVAWHSALLRPDLFRAVVGMSVPYAPPGKVDLITSLENAGIHDFYMQYFQAPGVAEAELDADPAASIRRIHHSGSGDGPRRTWRPPGQRRLPGPHRRAAGAAGLAERGRPGGLCRRLPPPAASAAV